MAMTMTIERVMAFMGLDVLVARDEGLFEAEGLDLRIAALPPDEMQSAAEGTPAKPTTNQGKLQARGEAQMFQAESAAITAGWRKALLARSRSEGAA
jgi:hypothetical protein